jgi:hypothetical protein
MSQEPAEIAEQWQRISLFCEGCQTDTQMVTMAVSPTEHIRLICICPKCGKKYQDKFTMEQLMALGESSDDGFETQLLCTTIIR